MASPRSFFAVTVVTVGMGALAGSLNGCDDPSSELSGGRVGRPGTTGSSGTGGSSGGAAGSAELKAMFQKVEPELTKTCGGANGQCHVNGTYPGSPPRFLAPDAYTSIKAYPGIVVKDVTSSAILLKPQHEGPGLTPDSDLEKGVREWLEAESLALSSVRLPSTGPITLQNGANDIDLTPAVTPGANLSGVHLKFNASLVGNILSLSNMRLSPAAGSGVHISKPRFVKIRGGAEVPDPADSFSNTDQTVAGGVETPLAPGSALFSSDGWTPFSFTSDQIRIEVDKLEPGTPTVVTGPTVCKNPAAFAANVLPTIRTTMAANGTCNSCHGGGTQPSLGGNDSAATCINILQRLNESDLSKSVMITKVTNAGHTGGLVNNAAAWQALFTNNKAVFF